MVLFLAETVQLLKNFQKHFRNISELLAKFRISLHSVTRYFGRSVWENVQKSVYPPQFFRMPEKSRIRPGAASCLIIIWSIFLTVLDHAPQTKVSKWTHRSVAHSQDRNMC
jgi:hypothetical protein